MKKIVYSLQEVKRSMNCGDLEAINRMINCTDSKLESATEGIRAKQNSLGISKKRK